MVDVFGGAVEDRGAKSSGETIAVEDESVEQLATAERHEEPRPKPGWAAVGEDGAGGFEGIEAEFERAGEEVDGDSGAEGRRRRHGEEDAGQGCSECGGEPRCECVSEARIAMSKGRRRGVEQRCP